MWPNLGGGTSQVYIWGLAQAYRIRLGGTTLSLTFKNFFGLNHLTCTLQGKYI